MNYRVLFLIPSFEYTDERTGKISIKYPHTGIAYLASMLKGNSIPFAILDMNLGYSYSYALEYVNTYKPDMICTTTYVSAAFFILMSISGTPSPLPSSL